MMGDGTIVSTSPLEWRSHIRAIAKARPVVVHERDIGQWLLLVREQLKSVSRTGRTNSGRTKSSFQRQIIDQRAK